MKLYDGVIESSLAALPSSTRPLPSEGASWPDAGDGQLVLRGDARLELGEGSLPGFSGVFLTSNRGLVPHDEVLLAGEDLPYLSGSAPYARLVYVLVDDAKLGEGNALYQAIRRIEYTRYHVNPKGFMMRISPLSRKESARVEETALRQGLDFAKVGSLMVDAYHKHSGVLAVKIVFVTDPSADYASLEKAVENGEGITKALDHLLNKVKMDCHSCSLQNVCSEVEGMIKAEKKQ